MCLTVHLVPVHKRDFLVEEGQKCLIQQYDEYAPGRYRPPYWRTPFMRTVIPPDGWLLPDYHYKGTPHYEDQITSGGIHYFTQGANPYNFFRENIYTCYAISPFAWRRTSLRYGGAPHEGIARAVYIPCADKSRKASEKRKYVAALRELIDYPDPKALKAMNPALQGLPI